jgi:hypothetical protein
MQKRPHVDCKSAEDLIKLLESEQEFLKKMIEKDKVHTEDSFKLNFVNRLQSIKSSLLDLQMHIDMNKEKVNQKTNDDFNLILEILDRYYEMKDAEFAERADDYVEGTHEDKSKREHENEFIASQDFNHRVQRYVNPEY